MFGKTYLLYEKQVADFVQQILPVMKEIMNKIFNLVTQQEDSYWHKEKYTLWHIIKNKKYEKKHYISIN